MSGPMSDYSHYARMCASATWAPAIVARLGSVTALPVPTLAKNSLEGVNTFSGDLYFGAIWALWLFTPKCGESYEGCLWCCISAQLVCHEGRSSDIHTVPAFLIDTRFWPVRV